MHRRLDLPPRNSPPVPPFTVTQGHIITIIITAPSMPTCKQGTSAGWPAVKLQPKTPEIMVRPDSGVLLHYVFNFLL